MPIDPAEITSPGRFAYEAYGDARMWKTVSGSPMPIFDDQLPELKQAWEVGARAAIAASHKLNAYQVCEEDLVAATSWEEAVTWHAKEHGAQLSDYDDDGEADDRGRAFEFFDDDIGKKRTTTVGELLAACTNWPCVIASTEY